jgi:hypothetical protein
MPAVATSAASTQRGCGLRNPIPLVHYGLAVQSACASTAVTGLYERKTLEKDNFGRVCRGMKGW